MLLNIINPIKLVLSKAIILFGFKQYIKYGKYKKAMINQMRYHNSIKQENKLKKENIKREVSGCQLTRHTLKSKVEHLWENVRHPWQEMINYLMNPVLEHKSSTYSIQ